MEDDWLVKHTHCGILVDPNRNEAKKHVLMWKELHRVAVSKKRRRTTGRNSEQPALHIHGFHLSGFKKLRMENTWGKKKKFQKAPKAKLE